MQILNQHNRAWSSEPIGESSLTVGGYGCLITSLAMLSSWFGKYRTPDWIAQNLNFTAGGLLLWKSMNGRLPFNFVYRYYKRDDAKIKSILASANNACVLEVPLGTGKHWVVLIGYSRIYGYKIADPFYGDTAYLNKRYKAITGFAEVAKA